MIPIDKQVCTQEQAKRLEELGVNHESACYWVFDSGMKWRVFPEGYFNPNEEGIEWRPAFTAAELGEMMPKKPGSAPEYFTCRDVYENAGVTVSGHICWKFKKDKESINKELIKIDGIKVFTTEAQARAALIIHLIEYRQTTADEVNARLSPNPVNP